MKNYYKDNQNNVLIISIAFNSANNPSLDIMIKATPISSFFEPLNEKKYETSIPQFEHFFSYIDLSINNYIIFKLNVINKEQNYMSIELHFLDDKYTEFSLHSDLSNLININNNHEYLFKNETIIDTFSIVDERNQNNKRSIIINLGETINEIFLVIFMKEKKNNLEKEFFSVKYYGLTNDDYQNGKYLYKNRFTIKSTKLNFDKEKNKINWEKIELINKKENKGEIKIDYFLKINKILNKDEFCNNNNGLFNYYNSAKDNFGKHLINKNEYELINTNNKEYLEIQLIAKFNELNGMENFLLYEPLLFSKETQEQNKNEENHDINERKKNKVSESNENRDIKYFTLRILIFILILIVIALIILSIYKFVRKIQIKNAYQKYIIENRGEKRNMALFDDDKLPFESKISFLIEN